MMSDLWYVEPVEHSCVPEKSERGSDHTDVLVPEMACDVPVKTGSSWHAKSPRESWSWGGGPKHGKLVVVVWRHVHWDDARIDRGPTLPFWSSPLMQNGDVGATPSRLSISWENAWLH